jgi:uncharacterized membrane protein
MGLSPLGIVHTLFGIAALISGAISLVSYKEIDGKTRAGSTYLLTTLVTAVTALFLFRHDGHFGPPHVLAILTLVALAVGGAASNMTFFGSAWRSVRAAAFTITLLFHLIPGFTETLTRIPPGAPFVASQESPFFQRLYPILLLLYLVGVVVQIRWLKANRAGGALSP